MGKLKKPPAWPYRIDVEDNDTSEEETDEPAYRTTKPDECCEVDNALSSTGNATPTPPCERPHRYAMVSNVNVNVLNILHFKPVEPDKC